MMSLPILNSRFFEEHKPNLGFFSKWSSFYAWSEQLLPVYEWQGVLYVGCSRPPKVFPHFEDQKIVLVLCEPGVLQDLWLDFQTSSPKNPKAAENSSHFSGLPSLPENHEDSEIDEISSPDFQPMETVVHNLSNSEMPEGLSLDLGSSPVSNEFSIENLTPAEDSDPTLKLEDTPEEEILNISASSEENESAELLDLTIGSDLQTSSLQGSGLVSLKPLDSKPESDPESLADLMKDPSESPSAEISSSESTEKRAKPVMTEVLSTGDVTRLAHQALTSTPAGKLEPWLARIFETMDQKFQKTMVLFKTGDHVKPWRWDANFNPSQPPKSTVSLVQPSPFRIVARTKKPYHGYVVPSDQAQKFFTEWNGSQIPEHLTIAPILVDDHVIGLLLAIGDKTCDSKENLQLAEHVAAEMAKQISSQAQSSRAA